jgi:segregation and condensation protein B
MPRQRTSTGSEAPAPDTTPAATALDEAPAAAAEDGIAQLKGGSTASDESAALDDGDLEGDEDAADAPAAEALPALVEALLFVSDGPVEPRTLSRALGVRTRAINAALEEVRTRLDGRGLMLQSGPDGAQLVTVPHAAPYVETFLGLEQNRRLSNAALEALAIVAYRQPVTRATIEAIRGVSSDGAIQTLRARGLIEDAGRAQGPGRPTLFVTTRRFLEHFGLSGQQDLPPLGDYELPPRDAPLPLPGLDGDAGAAGESEAAEHEVAEALASLSQAAQSLAGPERLRSGAAALLLPGALPLALPSPVEGNEADATPPVD